MPYRKAGVPVVRPTFDVIRQPSTASDAVGETGYNYESNDNSYVRFNDKSLPPGALPPRPNARLNDAERDRDELDRALQASKEQAEIDELLRRSRLEEEEAAALRQQEQEVEQAALRESRRRHEEERDRHDIEDFEEEEAFRRAVEESEREASRPNKGKTTRYVDDGTESDEELRKVIELSKVQHRESLGRWDGQDNQGASTSQAVQASARPTHTSPVSRGVRPPPMPRRPLPVPDISSRIPAHVVNQVPDEERLEAPPAYEPSEAVSNEDEAGLRSEKARRSAEDTENKRLCFYPSVAPDMTEGSMRVVVPHMLFANRTRRQADDYLPMTSRDLDPAALPPPSEEIMAQRPRRPLPPVPTIVSHSYSESPSTHPPSSEASFYSAGLSEPPPTTSSGVTSTTSPSQGHGEEGQSHEFDASAEDHDPFHDSHVYTPVPEDKENESHYRYQVSSVNSGSQPGTPRNDHSESPRTDYVGRHDYARAELGSDNLPRAVSPEVNNDEPAYDTDSSAGSFESAASDAELELPATNESAKEINHNISFGFNPLSSPTQHLEWQGRFPDAIVLSNYADDEETETIHRPDLHKEDYTTFAFEAPTWQELIVYLMWHGNSIFQPAPRDLQEAGSNPLRVSLIVEFVKETSPAFTLVRLQVHLLGDTMQVPSGSRGVSLSRKPLSSRPAPQQTATQQGTPFGNLRSTSTSSPAHLVFAFPKPFHSLPLTLSTIGKYLHNAQKASINTKENTRSADVHEFGSKAFLIDLARGIELCNGEDVKEAEDNRIDRMLDRLKQKRRSIRGTFKELHKRSKRRKGTKGVAAVRRNSQDSDRRSMAQPEDYYITPFVGDSRSRLQ